MPVAYRSASKSTGASGGNLTATEPAGAANGDVLVALFAQDHTTATLNLPSGWTEIGRGTGGAPNFSYVVGWIARGASAPSLTFTSNQTAWREVVIVCLSDAAFDAAQIATGTGTNDADPPSATATTASDVAVAMAYYFPGWGASPTMPTGYTQRAYTLGDGAIAATRALSASGAENPSLFDGGQGTGPWVAVTALGKTATGAAPADLAGTSAATAAATGALTGTPKLAGTPAAAATVTGLLETNAPKAASDTIAFKEKATRGEIPTLNYHGTP